MQFLTSQIRLFKLLLGATSNLNCSYFQFLVKASLNLFRRLPRPVSFLLDCPWQLFANTRWRRFAHFATSIIRSVVMSDWYVNTDLMMFIANVVIEYRQTIPTEEVTSVRKCLFYTTLIWVLTLCRFSPVADQPKTGYPPFPTSYQMWRFQGLLCKCRSAASDVVISNELQP